MGLQIQHDHGIEWAVLASGNHGVQDMLPGIGIIVWMVKGQDKKESAFLHFYPEKIFLPLVLHGKFNNSCLRMG